MILVQQPARKQEYVTTCTEHGRVGRNTNQLDGLGRAELHATELLCGGRTFLIRPQTGERGEPTGRSEVWECADGKLRQFFGTRSSKSLARTLAHRLAKAARP